MATRLSADQELAAIKLRLNEIYESIKLSDEGRVRPNTADDYLMYGADLIEIGQALQRWAAEEREVEELAGWPAA